MKPIPPRPVSRPLTPQESAFLTYIYEAIGVPRPLIDSALPKVRLHDGKRTDFLPPYGTWILNPKVAAITFGPDQYYKNGIPPKNNPAYMALIGHETCHTMQADPMGLYPFLGDYLLDSGVQWFLGLPDPYKNNKYEQDAYIVGNLIKDFSYLFPMFSDGAQPGSKERDLIKGALENYLNNL